MCFCSRHFISADLSYADVAAYDLATVPAAYKKKTQLSKNQGQFDLFRTAHVEV
jgi:hypothetical protein